MDGSTLWSFVLYEQFFITKFWIIKETIWNIYLSKELYKSLFIIQFKKSLPIFLHRSPFASLLIALYRSIPIDRWKKLKMLKFYFYNLKQEEAENERMHLMTFLQIRQPGPMFRIAVILTQWIFTAIFSTAYLFSPKFCHRSKINQNLMSC